MDIRMDSLRSTIGRISLARLFLILLHSVTIHSLVLSFRAPRSIPLCRFVYESISTLLILFSDYYLVSPLSLSITSPSQDYNHNLI
jgi:hypothetical protein